MNDQRRVHQLYRRVSVRTAPPEEQMINLLAEAVKEIQKGKRAIENQETPARNKSLLKAQDCVLQLISYVNDQSNKGERLIALYGYVNRLLIRANIEKNGDLLQEAEEFLLNLTEDWNEALRNRRKKYKGDLF
ncbi:flagellar export chaperone FliS [Bacillus xiapuensis]|uniref:flagellar export chaperone FliS n=1 Tax=Bacillus xiapuensis TaxID=2014075 RepID=UPI000C24A7B8|nr:flagellar export chaperone FliS [Bacillus xiapuensis]